MGCGCLFVHQLSHQANGNRVANGCFLLTSGRLADLYGRRNVFFVGSVMYLIFTVLCGISQNGIMLFLFRGFQGIGGAILVPGAVGIVGATYHKYDKRKALAFSVIGGMATTGFLAGILLGGICAQLLTWRWLFFITAMITGAMILSTFFIVPKMAGEDESSAHQSRRGKYKEIDWWGQIFSISGLVLLAFSLTYSSEAPKGWATWYIIFLLILSFVLLGSFIFVEYKRGSRAMMPLKIWKSSHFSLSMFILFFGWMDFEIVTLYMTFLYSPSRLPTNDPSFQNVRGVSPLLCTLYFLPDVIFGMITALVMARAIPRCKTQYLLLIGLLFLLSAPLLMVFSPADQSYWPQSFPAISLSSIGGMTLFNVSNVFVSSSVAREDQGLGQGIFNTVVQIGTAISLAIAATVAHAGGVSADADRMALLEGYRHCFWLAVGCLAPPIVGCFFLKGTTASSGGDHGGERRDRNDNKHVEDQENKGKDLKEQEISEGNIASVDKKLSEIA